MKIKLFLLFIILLFIAGCFKEEVSLKPIEVKENKENNQTSKNILMIIAPKDFREEELNIPRANFEKNNFKVFVASSERTAFGMFGLKVDVDLLLEDALKEINNFDAVVLVGGSGSVIYFNDSTVREIVLNAYKNNKVIGAICLAPIILANSGILENKRATVFDHEYIELIREKGAIYSNEDVVVDDNIITANSPNSALKFSNEIIKRLKQN
ncbi:MAG: DJ-1/PfpI family protein [Candidatus Woesearchaeota archaeon]